jgi:adenylate cyclase class 2
MREIEIKILNVDTKKIEKKLRALGAKRIEKCLIHDKLFNYPDMRIPKDELFRVRNHENRVEITYKANPGKSEFLEHDEYQTEVKDFDTICKILELLGLIVTCDRQKKRTSYKLGKVKFEIDKYPTIPSYMEIEGNKEDIKKMLGKLGFTMKDTTNMNATQVLKYYKQDPSYQRFKK